MTTNVAENQDEKKRERKQPRSRRRARKPQAQEREFEQSIIEVSRVTRVTKGGKQMSFRATVAVGDKKSKVAIGLGKGADVTDAINKAVNQAKKSFVMIPLTEDGTIPHEVKCKLGAAQLMMRPAPLGKGIIAGGVMRIIFELGGVQNIVGKMYGSRNKVNNAKATLKALSLLESVADRKNHLS